jgi:tetratricopeptide (TPR) repeat protein
LSFIPAPFLPMTQPSTPPAATAPIAPMHVALVLLLAFALRLVHIGSALAGPLGYQPGPDEAFYADFAQALLAGRGGDPLYGFMDPGYGYLLAAVAAIAGPGPFPVYLLQALVDTGTAWMVFRIGVALGRPRAGLWGALAYGLAATAVLMVASLQKESWVAAFMAAWVLAALGALRRDRAAAWLGFGLLCGIGVALRANLLLMAGLAVLVLPFLVAPEARTPSGLARRGAWLLAGLALPLALLAARNAALSGEATPLPTNGGIVLHQVYNADNPRALSAAPPFVRYYNPVEVWRGYVAEDARRNGPGRTPAQASDYWGGEAVAYLRAHPGQALANMARKLGESLAWTEVANNRSLVEERLFSPVLRVLPAPYGWLLALGLPGLFLLARADRRGWLAWAPVLACAFTAAVFFAEDRFRFPALPLLALGLGVAVEAAWAWGRARRFAPFAGLLAACVAIAALSGMLASRLPPPTITWNRIAWGWQAMGRDDAAAEAALRGLREHPDDANLHELMGLLAARAGDLDPAIAAYGRAVQLRPDGHVARYNLAKLLARRGDAAGALVHARAAAALAPDPDYAALVRELEGR